MNAIILFNRCQLARKLNRDARTVKSHLSSLRIAPDALSPSGQPLYGERTLSTLAAQIQTAHDLAGELRGHFEPSSTLTSNNAS